MPVSGNFSYCSFWHNTKNDWDSGYHLWTTDGASLRFNIATSSSANNYQTYQAFSNFTGLFDGKWHHIVGQFDSAAQEARIYVDGKLDTVIELDNTDPLFGQGSSHQDVGFFSFSESAYTPYNSFSLQEVRVWDTIRTQQEIITNMFTQLGGSESGLVGYYKCDEMTGTTVSDSASSPADGSLEYQNSARAWVPWVAGASGGTGPWGITGGTWTAGGTLSSSACDLYIGNLGAEATIFASSYFPIAKTDLQSGNKKMRKLWLQRQDFQYTNRTHYCSVFHHR